MLPLGASYLLRTPGQGMVLLRIGASSDIAIGHKCSQPGRGRIASHGPQACVCAWAAAFRGSWIVTRELVAVSPDDDTVVDPAVRALLNRPVTYRQRYIERDGQVIADRLYNEPLKEAAMFPDKKVVADRTTWDISNPNVLTLSYADGGVREVKVTKRSSDSQPEVSGFGTTGTSGYSVTL